LSYFNSVWPIAALVVLIVGIVISVIPLIQQVAEGEVPLFDNGSGVLWAVVFTCGIAPGAIFNVIQEKYLKMRIIDRKGALDDINDRNITNAEYDPINNGNGNVGLNNADDDDDDEKLNWNSKKKT